MKHRIASLVLVSLLPTTAAIAGPYVVGSGVRADHNVSDLDKPFGAALTVGFEAEDVPLFVEGELYQSSKYGFDGEGKDFSDRGLSGYAGVAIPFSDHFRVMLKAGYYSLRLKIDGEGSATEQDFAVGGGFEVLFDEQVGIRAEIENLVFDNAKDSQLYKVGLIWRAKSGHRNYETNPVYTPPAAPLADTPSAAAAAVAPAFKPGDEALARPGSVLRAAPMEGAAVVQNLSPSPLMKLENSIVNSTGEWWFVSTDVERGWLRGDQLIKP